MDSTKYDPKDIEPTPMRALHMSRLRARWHRKLLPLGKILPFALTPVGVFEELAAGEGDCVHYSALITRPLDRTFDVLEWVCLEKFADGLPMPTSLRVTIGASNFNIAFSLRSPMWMGPYPLNIPVAALGRCKTLEIVPCDARGLELPLADYPLRAMWVAFPCPMHEHMTHCDFVCAGGVESDSVLPCFVCHRGLAFFTGIPATFGEWTCGVECGAVDDAS
jgi:hypothetical protein